MLPAIARVTRTSPTSRSALSPARILSRSLSENSSRLPGSRISITCLCLGGSSSLTSACCEAARLLEDETWDCSRGFSPVIPQMSCSSGSKLVARKSTEVRIQKSEVRGQKIHFAPQFHRSGHLSTFGNSLPYMIEVSCAGLKLNTLRNPGRECRAENRSGRLEMTRTNKKSH
jgi:hypothetical protein